MSADRTRPASPDHADGRFRTGGRGARPARPAASGGSAELLRAVRALIRGTPVRTMAHVDALITLYHASPHPCTLAELAEAACVPPGTVARRCADDLVEARLATRLADADAYRYAPAAPALRAGVAALVAIRSRRALLVRLLAAYGAEPLRDVADEGS